MNRSFLLSASLTLSLLAVLPSAHAADLETELNWKRHWRNYAQRCAQLGNQFYTLALYEPNYYNSRGVTRQIVRAKTAKQVRERTGTNVSIRRHYTRPDEDIRYVTDALPAMAVGNYGWIHSAQVQVIGNSTGMIVDEVYVLDPVGYKKERRAEEEKVEKILSGREADKIIDWRFEFRDQAYDAQRDKAWRRPIKLLGFSTIGLQKEQRWLGKVNLRPTDEPGARIAIVAEETKNSEGKPRKSPMLVAVPLDLFKRGITDEKVFLALLKSKGFTKETFVKLVLQERRANSRDLRLADARIFEALEGRLEGFDKKEFGDAPRTSR